MCVFCGGNDGRVGSGRVGSGRVGSGLVWSGRVGTGRVGTGRVWSGLVGSGRVGSGRVGSGRVGSGLVWSGRVGTGRVGTGRDGLGRVGSVNLIYSHSGFSLLSVQISKTNRSGLFILYLDPVSITSVLCSLTHSLPYVLYCPCAHLCTLCSKV